MEQAGDVKAVVDLVRPHQQRERPQEKTESDRAPVREPAGRAPFEAKTTNDLMAAILSAAPEPLLNVPDELQLIIKQALRQDRAERYQTVEDLLIDLKQLKERLPKLDQVPVAAKLEKLFKAYRPPEPKK